MSVFACACVRQPWRCVREHGQDMPKKRWADLDDDNFEPEEVQLQAYYCSAFHAHSTFVVQQMEVCVCVSAVACAAGNSMGVSVYTRDRVRIGQRVCVWIGKPVAMCLVFSVEQDDVCMCHGRRR